jgi:glutamine synthetase
MDHAHDEFLAAHGIDTVELATPDVTGALRGKRLPLASFRENGLAGDVGLSSAVLAWDYAMEVLEVGDYDWKHGYSDVFLRPDLGTLRPVPWKPRTALVFCDLVDGRGEAVRLSPRTVLRDAQRRCTEAGYDPFFALESEFYVLDRETLRPGSDRNPVYSLHDNVRLEPLLAEICAALEEAGVPVEACGGEYAPGQVEINLTPSDPLSAADDLLFFRYAVKQLAERHGHLATFMGKPFGDLSGSGLHVHQSLWRPGRTENVFYDAERDGLSATARHYAAGLLRYSGEAHLVAAPTPNAYKRLTGHSFAPVNLTWGVDNRSVAVRGLVRRGHGTRWESRVAAADANPYLVQAYQLSAGLAGIAEGIEPDPQASLDAYTAPGAEPLPTHLAEAAGRLRDSPFAQEALGKECVELLCAIARREDEAYRSQVSDWERGRYLSAV